MTRTYRTVNRFFALLEMLGDTPQGMTVKRAYARLHEDHPADERTYRRDLENLEYLGFLVSETDSNGQSAAARYRVNRKPNAGKPLELSLRELFALYVGRKLLQPLRETPLFGDLETCFNKIEKVIGIRSRTHLATLVSDIHFDTGPRWGIGIQSEVLGVLEQACAERHILEADYRSNSQATGIRRLGPHFLYFSKNSLYLVAEDLKDGRIKVFAVPRITHAAMTEEEYTMPKIDPSAYFSGSFGVFRGKSEGIELVFYPPFVASVQETRWHASQRVTQNKDGTVTLSLNVAVTPELVQWVLSFGSHVRIRSPHSLRVQVQAQASAILELYDDVPMTRAA